MSEKIDFLLNYPKDVSHLKDLSEYILIDNNKFPGKCLKINIYPTNHLFSTGTPNGCMSFMDHKNQIRYWDINRYNSSLQIPYIFSHEINSNCKLSEETPRKGMKNYAILRPNNGLANYDIFFYLLINNHNACCVDLYITSAYTRSTHLSAPKRKIHHAARTAFFSKKRQP